MTKDEEEIEEDCVGDEDAPLPSPSLHIFPAIDLSESLPLHC